MLTATQQSDAILSQMINSWDDTHVIPTRIGHIHVGQRIPVGTPGRYGTVQALAVIEDEGFAWLEFPDHDGIHAHHIGVPVNDLVK